MKKRIILMVAGAVVVMLMSALSIRLLLNLKVNQAAQAHVDAILDGHKAIDVYVPITRSLDTVVISENDQIHRLRQIIRCESCRRVQLGTVTTSGGTSIELTEKGCDYPSVRVTEFGLIIVSSDAETYFCDTSDRSMVQRIADETKVIWPPLPAKWQSEVGKDTLLP